ncbi:G-type lectin S-receptor-like serine/threonine-protein kinase At4g27290 isoform X2 [Rhododendron vialii]|uniref:G-type lectin S-receptor-like serine/threonine-protein kinase At4g27290 isoform X2 n=1 Tax=Rhododendron vialii TaxID=182163 RepID=UPI0026602E42|nr:G-type lectin S-receptor-like serine/threonine-protein kinase At4g27290 isoform X2 [Rhododendron vialii]
MAGFAIPLLLCYTILSTSIPLTTPTDIITPTQTTGVTDTVVSAGGNTELGFFTPSGKPNHWYLGIWYKKISTRTVVWVANREIPLTDSLGILQLTQEGNLQLVNSSGSIIWSSNVSRPVQNPVAQLLDTGNLVVREGNDTNPENFFWESFDFPTDNLLAGMKFWRNLKSGLDRYLTSWRSTDDPAPGNFTYRLDLRGYPELILRSGDTVQFRSGPWNGLRFSGFNMLVPNPVYTFGFVFNQEEVYYYFELVNVSVVTRLVLNPSGLIQRFTWVDRTRGWVLYSSAQTDNCDSYALCGVYGSCNINRSPPCWCLNGFVPNFPQDWDKADWSQGCVRRVQLDCLGDGFVQYSGVKLPDTKGSWFNVTMSLEECQRVCLENCSCTAYTSLDVRGGGSGCLLWIGDLIDIREYNENGQDLYIRMAASELDTNAGSTAKKKEKVAIAASVVTGGLLFLGLSLILWMCKRKQRLKGKRTPSRGYIYTRGRQKEELELPLFDLATISKATNNFSEHNKLGEGGFGSVYKGILMEGQEIAVKRLSKDSRQDEKRSMLLDWPNRFNIIIGIARGLLYLHQDSRLRIIHRDLKAENVLLDNEMNPKISDFGLARSFRGNETEAKTKKVVGTHGYISPEYAVHGVYSMKSDVFSFGVLVLEILSGKRNRSFHHPDHDLNLLGHAWKLYIEGRPLELVDALVRESWFACEVLRSIHVGLLCVQQRREDRPSMSTVVVMLGGEGALPQPKQPAFFTETSPLEADLPESKNAAFSGNEGAISEIEAR